MRGEDNLASSISIAEREEGPEGIADVIRCEEPLFGHQYGTASLREKPVAVNLRQEKGNFHVKPGLGFDAFLQNFDASGG